MTKAGEVTKDLGILLERGQLLFSSASSCFSRPHFVPLFHSQAARDHGTAMGGGGPPYSVFIGNVPYDATEERLRDMFSEVGVVHDLRCVSLGSHPASSGFLPRVAKTIVCTDHPPLTHPHNVLCLPHNRLMTDRETGKLKGFGFCEFMDVATAESAKRNLNGRDYNGRQLRVDFAGEDGDEGKKPAEKPSAAGAGASPMLYDAPMGTAPAQAAQRQMRDAGLGGGGGMDAVTSRLAEMSPAQLFSVMHQLKTLTTQNQSQTRALLVANPQLTLALFQAQLALGMTKPLGAAAATAGGAPAPGAPQGTAPLPPPPGAARPGMGMGPGIPGMGPGIPGMPPHLGNPGMPQYNHNPQFPPPPPRGVAPLPPPPIGGPPPGPPPPAGAVDQQQQLLQQVISMTPEQMNLLPPDQRQQVEMLRQLAVQQGMM